MTLQQLREKRVALVAQARAMLDTAEKSGETLSTADQQIFDRIMEESDKLGDQIQRAERVAAVESALNQPAPRQAAPGQPGAQNPAPGSPPAALSLADPRYRELFAQCLVRGREALNGHPLATEFLSLSAGKNVEGGYLVAPEQFVAELIQAMDNMTFMRAKARVIGLTTAASLGAPSLDADPADPVWTSEIATGDEDSTMAFGKRSLTPHPLAKRIKVSNKLLRVSAMPAEQIVRDRLGYKFAVTEEAAYMTGNGINKPLGVFTASDDGIPTSRDVATGNTSSSPTFDGLAEAFYNQKTQYQQSAEWLFHRDAIKLIRKLKDGASQYIWQPSMSESAPDTILGRPVNQSEYCPNTFTTGQYVGLFGDFKYYWIAESLEVQIQRLVELYAETNQTGFIGRREVDGMPVLAEAFTRVKLG